MSEIGERIKKLRLGLGLKQVQFASQVRVSQGYLAEVEKGKKNPSGRVMLAISTIFGVDEEWLRTGRGKKFRNEEIQLSKEEREVVNLYRRLKPAQQVDLIKQLKKA